MWRANFQEKVHMMLQEKLYLIKQKRQVGVHYNFEDFTNGKDTNAIKKVIPIDISYGEYTNLWNQQGMNERRNAKKIPIAQGKE